MSVLPDPLVVKRDSDGKEILDPWGVQRDLEALSSRATSSGSGFVAGMIMMWPGAAAPAGWLFCTGGSYLVADYPNLFAKIGYVFGGAGANFNTPQFMDAFAMGANGTTVGVGTQGGANAVTLVESEMPTHEHDIIETSGAFMPNISNETSAAGGVGHYVRALTGILKAAAKGGSQPHENRPKFLGINFIIKT